MDYNQIAKDILQNVGGQENIDNLTHCFTRLRFVLKDESKVNKEVLERIEGVISVVFAGGQCQVVCGAKVTKIYEAVASVMGLSEEEVAGQPKKEEEKTNAIITEEDIAQQVLYAANASDDSTEAEQAAAMLAMLGADIQ